MKKIFTLYLFCLITIVTNAQDVHLSQYYTSNLFLNPALTGNYVGDIRAVLNYRSQWKQVVQPLTTAAFSVEKKFTNFSNTFGIGANVINDKLNTLGLQNNSIYLSGSYSKTVKQHVFSFGLQGGVIIKNFDLSAQTFGNQFDYPTGNYNTGLPSNEQNLQDNQTYFNLNSGIHYTKLMVSKTFNLGYAIFSLNKPKYGFTSNEFRVPFRHVINSSLNFDISKTFSVKPHFLYMLQAKATDIILGANAKKSINKDIALLLGVGYRTSVNNGDAGIVIGGFNYKRFESAISFDINTSELSNNSQRKSVWEISLIYTTPSRSISKSTINCDRY